MNNKSGAILVVSGPSGAGKSTLINAMMKDLGDCYFSISTTTRPMREGEVDGVHYHFVTKEEFEKDIQEGHFLEYALVHSNYYGTSLKPVKKALQEKKLVIFDIDVQGNEAIKKQLGDITTSVFVTTPTLTELENRLTTRSTDSAEVISKRIAMAKEEVKRVGEYEFLVVNDKLEEAVQTLTTIAKAARLKIEHKDVQEFIQKWVDKA